MSTFTKYIKPQTAEFEIYTDGARRRNQNTAGPASYAMAVFQGGTRKGTKTGVLPNGTNNQAELSGIILALSWAVKAGVVATIYCDSQYVVKGYNNWLDGWVRRGWKKADNTTILNLELWKEIHTLKEKAQFIKVEHVKGHSGNKGNELADLLCNVALDEWELNKL